MSAPIVKPRYKVVQISKTATDSYYMYMIVNLRGEKVGEYYTKGMAEEVAAELTKHEAD